jgi:hypothetical protein
VMADSQDGLLVPSANNVAVLHPGQSLPTFSSPDTTQRRRGVLPSG